MVTEQLSQEKTMTGDLERKETPEREEAIQEKPVLYTSFAELMNPEFIAQFKGCWRW